MPIFHEPDASPACNCTRCLLTVAMANDRNELERVARSHVCRQAESLIKKSEGGGSSIHVALPGRVKKEDWGTLGAAVLAALLF